MHRIYRIFSEAFAKCGSGIFAENGHKKHKESGMIQRDAMLINFGSSRLEIKKFIL